MRDRFARLPEVPLGADVGPDAEVHVEAGVGDGLDERGQVLAALEVVLPLSVTALPRQTYSVV